MKKKRHSIVSGSILFFGLISFLTGYSQSMALAANQNSDTQKSSMNVEHKNNTEPKKVPPIDAAAPAAFETASFGLG